MPKHGGTAGGGDGRVASRRVPVALAPGWHRAARWWRLDRPERLIVVPVPREVDVDAVLEEEWLKVGNDKHGILGAVLISEGCVERPAVGAVPKSK